MSWAINMIVFAFKLQLKSMCDKIILIFQHMGKILSLKKWKTKANKNPQNAISCNWIQLKKPWGWETENVFEMKVVLPPAALQLHDCLVLLFSFDKFHRNYDLVHTQEGVFTAESWKWTCD